MDASSIHFDTGQIGPLRELLKKLSTLQAAIADFVQFRVVIDANCVIQNTIYRVRHPERGPTALEEMIKATVIDVYAPRWLDLEMSSAIRQASAKTHLLEPELWARWLEFRPLLKWDESLCRPGIESSEHCDPKDQPYIALEKRLGADGILSKDHHIAQMGGHLLTLDFVLSARRYARAAVMTVSIRVIGTVASTVALMALVGLLRGMGRALTALPTQLRTLLLVGGLLVALNPSCRRWIAERCGAACEAAEPAWDGFAELVTTLAAANNRAKLEAAVHLHETNKVTRPKRFVGASTPALRRHRSRARTVGGGASGAAPGPKPQSR